MRIRSLSHSVYQLQYHIVWGTKYRRKFIIPAVKQELLHSLFETVKKYIEWQDKREVPQTIRVIPPSKQRRFEFS